MKNYVVATIKDWHKCEFEKRKCNDFKNWKLITNSEDLCPEKLAELNPRYIFFPHWSWIVPDVIINNFECVCFHSTDVPYGRGGSPIQNMIIRGFKETKVSALRMVKELDAGPVYCKKSLSLKGKAQHIFEQSATIIADMMRWIADEEPRPSIQNGEVVAFKRRGGKDNMLPLEGNLEHLYNHIRMLDAKSYPKSFLNYGEFKLEFLNASLNGDTLEASVKIERVNEKNSSDICSS